MPNAKSNQYQQEPDHQETVAVEQVVTDPASEHQRQNGQQAHHAGTNATRRPDHGADTTTGPGGDDSGHLLLQRLKEARTQQEAQRPQEADRGVVLRSEITRREGDERVCRQSVDHQASSDRASALWESI